MKDFNRLLAKGNFTPKERILLLIANTVKQDTTGKEFLSEADKRALGEGWQPQNNNEVEEYNRFNRGWKMACTAEMDAQTIYLGVKVKFQSAGIMLKDFVFYPFYSEVKKALDELGKIKRVEPKEAMEIINAQRQEKLKSGNTIDEIINQLAYELAGEETKKKLEELYADVDLSTYLDEVQELISLNEKKDFEAIAQKVSKKCYNDYIKQYQLFHNYAGIDLEEIAKRYAKENNLPFIEKPDEDKELDAIEELAKTFTKHAQEKNTTVEAIIKQTCLKWLNEGLLEKDYVIEKEERGLIAKWTESKLKAKEVLQDLINKGELKTGKNEDGTEIITGESLYNSGLDYDFIKDFKSYTNDYNPELGLVKGEGEEYKDKELLITKEKSFSRFKMHLDKATSLLDTLSIVQEKEENGEIVLDIEQGKIRDYFFNLRNSFISEYEKLLAFEPLFKDLSKTFEMDLTFRINLWINECKEMIDSFNNTLLRALKNDLPRSPQSGKKKHYKDNELFIDKDKIKPNNPLVELYRKELTDTLGSDFK